MSWEQSKPAFSNKGRLKLTGNGYSQNAIEQKARRRARGGVNRVGEGKVAFWDDLEA